MNRFFEKHGLLKISSIFLVLAIVLTWLVSLSYFNAGTLVSDEVVRLGLFDITTYGFLAITYFIHVFVFVFIAAGFYKFLGSTEAYDKLTSNIANVFKGKEKILVAISTLVFACLSGITTDYLYLLAIIPFVISILAKLKVDKVVGFASTFGGVLIGILGSTYSTKVAGQLVNASYGLGVQYGNELVGTIVVLAIAYLLILYFAFNKMSKKSDSLLTDVFMSENATPTKRAARMPIHKISVIPMAITLVITFIVLILAFIGWEEAFGVTVFTNAFDWINNATLFDQPIYSYILGSDYFAAFGKWDLFGAVAIILVTTLIIKVLYRIPMDKVISEYGEGFKKFGKTGIILLVIYTTLFISVSFPTIPYFIDAIVKSGVNLGTIFISNSLMSAFAVEFQYVVSMLSTVFTSFESLSIAALALQLSYGFISFIAPTSVVLMLGLSLLDIKFNEYFKFIWKFLISILIVIIVVLAILFLL